MALSIYRENFGHRSNADMLATAMMGLNNVHVMLHW